MATGTFAYRTRIHLNRFDIHIVQAQLESIVADSSGALVIQGAEKRVASLNAIRGDANSLARMKKLAVRHGATLLEDTRAVKAMLGEGDDAPKAKTKAKTAQTARPIKGWRLLAFKPEWGLVNGKERWYNVGTSPSRERVVAVQKAWIDAGYSCQTKELRPRVTEVKDTLWDTPSEPIVSRIPNDPWVGDHLGPHLRKMGMTMNAYRDTFNYTGPAMVNRAARSLSKAHNSIRRGTMIKMGMMVAQIRGDRDVDVFKITNVTDTHVDLVGIVGTTVKPGAGAVTVTRSALVTDYKPIEKWPNSTKDKETK